MTMACFLFDHLFIVDPMSVLTLQQYAFDDPQFSKYQGIKQLKLICHPRGWECAWRYVLSFPIHSRGPNAACLFFCLCGRFGPFEFRFLSTLPCAKPLMSLLGLLFCLGPVRIWVFSISFSFSLFSFYEISNITIFNHNLMYSFYYLNFTQPSLLFGHSFSFTYASTFILKSFYVLGRQICLIV